MGHTKKHYEHGQFEAVQGTGRPQIEKRSRNEADDVGLSPPASGSWAIRFSDLKDSTYDLHGFTLPFSCGYPPQGD